MRTVYIVMAESGDYDDRVSNPVMVYDREEDADAACAVAMVFVREADATRRRHPRGCYSNEAQKEWREYLTPKIAALGLGGACENYEVCGCPIKEAAGS